mgnify:CR=1 FL=1
MQPLPLQEKQKIADLAAQGAIFYCSHSGGKDSQAMHIALSMIIPQEQIVIVHADLGAIEWRGVQDHIAETTGQAVNVVSAGKSFFDMVRHRAATRPDVPAWPSSATRQCTSDLKRDPIHTFIRRDMKARGASLAVNCTGLRAAESAARRRKPSLSVNARLSKAGRKVYEYLPIQHMTDRQVFALIHLAGQKPFWAYRKNQRLSCVFCIMGSDNDLRHGAQQRPDLYQDYLDLEAETGWTMFNGKSLQDRVEMAAA